MLNAGKRIVCITSIDALRTSAHPTHNAFYLAHLTALSPQDYLQFSQQVKQSFIEPDELKSLTKPLRITSEQLSQKIIATNPKLNNQSLSYTCTGGGRFLQEIHVCLDKTGNALACSDEIQRKSRRSCGQVDFLIRNVR